MYFRLISNIEEFIGFEKGVSLAVVGLSWKSSYFQHQRSVVRIQSAANLIYNQLNQKMRWKDKIKEKEAGNADFLKRSIVQNNRPINEWWLDLSGHILINFLE